MKLIFSDAAWEDYLYWQQQDKRMVERINKLIKETPAKLFKNFAGKVSRGLYALPGVMYMFAWNEYMKEGEKKNIEAHKF